MCLGGCFTLCVTSLLAVPVPLMPVLVQLLALFSLVACKDACCADSVQAGRGDALDPRADRRRHVPCSAAQPFYLCAKVANTFYSV